MSRQPMGEEEIIGQMIGLHCRKRHGQIDGLCPKCGSLYDYAIARIHHCPRGESKTFCSTCPIHCYREEMRQQIRAVMKFSGPRMLFYCPSWAFAHILNTLKHKKHRSVS